MDEARALLRSMSATELADLYCQITLCDKAPSTEKDQLIRAIIKKAKSDIIVCAQLYVRLGLVEGKIDPYADIELREPITIEQIFREIAEEESKKTHKPVNRVYISTWKYLGLGK